MDPPSTGWVLFKSTHCRTQWVNCEQNPWVLSQITSKSTQWVLCERTPQFLSQFTSQCAHRRTSATCTEFFESSFKMYPVMWSQCTQWVFFKEPTKNSLCGSILPQTLKEIIEYVSAHDFSNHFEPSFSQIGKPNSHGCYTSQRKTPYPLVFLPPLCQITPRRTKNDIVIGEDYGTITLGIPMGYTAE